MISAPTTMICTCSAISVENPSQRANTLVMSTGSSTMKAAPISEPTIEPRPPMMIMKSTSNDLSMLNASVTSTAPVQSAK